MADVAELVSPSGDWRGWDLEAMADRKIGVYEFINHFAAGVKDTTYTKTLFTDYIWPKFWQKALLYVDNAPEGDEWTFDDIRDAWNKKAGLIFSWINESKEVYELLISQLEANKTKLLNQIKSTSSTKFNDTPQEPGVFTEDQYTSNITATETTTDANTMMARLKEIQNDLKSLYAKWSNEFGKFIFFSAN